MGTFFFNTASTKGLAKKTHLWKSLGLNLFENFWQDSKNNVYSLSLDQPSSSKCSRSIASNSYFVLVCHKIKKSKRNKKCQTLKYSGCMTFARACDLQLQVSAKPWKKTQLNVLWHGRYRTLGVCTCVCVFPPVWCLIRSPAAAYSLEISRHAGCWEMWFEAGRIGFLWNESIHHTADLSLDSGVL